MSADFNAGSIEGSLELDTSPFETGLRRAQEQARRFEHERVTPELGLDRREFDAEHAVARAELGALDHERANPRVDLDIGAALAKIALLKHAMNSGLDAGGLGKAVTGPSLGVAKITAMAGGLMSLAAAAGPATAAVVGFAGAAGVAFAGAIPAIALFGKSVGGAFEQIQNAIKAGKQLPGVAGQAETAFKNMSKSWKELQKAAAPQVFGFLKTTFNDIAGLLPRLAPLLKTVATGMTGVVNSVFAVTKTPLFSKFLTQLQQFMHGFLDGLGPVLANMLKTFMHLFSALQPLMSMLGHGIMQASEAMEKFSARLDHGGIKPFIGYMKEFLPLLGSLVGDIFKALGSIGKGIAPLAGPAIKFLDALVKGIGSLNFAPFAKGFGQVLEAAQPLIGVLGAFINTVLPPLGKLLGVLADKFIKPLATSLVSELQPAFSKVGEVLDKLTPYIGDFIASIANLVNPTGVHLLVTIIEGLGDVLEKVGPPILQLATWLEGLIDKGIEAALPYFAKFFGWLNRLLTPTSALSKSIRGNLTGAFKAIQPTLREVWKHIQNIGDGFMKLWPTIESTAKSLFHTLWPAFKKIGAVIVKEVIPQLFQLYDWFVNKILPVIVTSLAPVLKSLAKTFANQVVPAVIKLWHSIRPLIPVLEKVAEVVFKVAGFLVRHLLPPLIKLAGWIVGHVIGAIANMISILTSLGRFSVATARFISNFGAEVGKAFDWAKKKAGEAKDWIVDKWNLMMQFFRGIPGDISGIASSMWTPISNAFSTMVSYLKGLWNNLADHLHFKLPGALGGASFGLPHWYATGGVAVGPQVIGVGDNPGGHEAVIPLDKYDIPKKGESARASAREAAQRREEIAMLHAALREQTAVLRAMLHKMGYDDLVDALGKMSEAQMRKLIQMVRAHG